MVTGIRDSKYYRYLGKRDLQQYKGKVQNGHR